MIRLVTFALCTHSILAICGAFEIHQRIVNGHISQPNAHPFYVKLESNGFRCGASLISDRWIVTAAHCIEPTHAEVWLGFENANSYLQKALVPRNSQFIHPEYNGTSANDIALLKLSDDLELSPQVKIAKLPADCRSMRQGNDRVTVAGAGRFTVGESEPDVPLLRQMSTRTVAGNVCARLMRSFGAEAQDQRALICVKPNNGQSAYHGDSGGPVILDHDGTLIGVMSNIFENLEEADPKRRFHLLVAPNIRYHFEWISAVAGLDLPKC